MKCYNGNVGHFWFWTNLSRSSIIINVPVVDMAREVMILIANPLEGVGPRKLRFSGPTPPLPMARVMSL
jgi:hypothetical protein